MEPAANPTTVQYATIQSIPDFHWPTLSELNDELNPFINKDMSDEQL